VNLLTDLEEVVEDHRPHGTLTGDATLQRGPLVGLGRSDSLFGSLLHDHPPNLLEEGVDVDRAPFLHSAVHFGRESLPTSLVPSSVEDYVDVGIVGEARFQSYVRDRIPTRDDK
jgi:hypothetical protein